ncbi:hypothetical protein LTR78_003236 [Recurvomyces mirabilis]|uniref:Inositol polyphosphate-related phosphatase domain-containing protein n=1 Tax=Recurvomyces mirabilis TaxID=574656 RepID=A0AAE1C3W7_9PEZI|nr:hypothetical protein LTR78_003236 [Recurvomyces mirabilis]KAK5156947.1 hypothetical protein LTS14_004464 [Recurvomyces mirabilis]
MAEISCYITTFNCGRTLINTDFFATTLFNALKTNLPPDLIVLCLQEVAPISHSFLGGSLLTPYFDRFAEAVSLASSRKFGNENTETEYVPLLTRNVGMTAIMAFGLHHVAHRVRWSQTAGVGVGVYGEMGNKGAVGVRLGLGIDGEHEDIIMTFVAAHLAPMEEAWQRRNEDWKSICEGLSFEAPHASPEHAEQKRSLGSGENEPLLAGSSDGTTEHGKKAGTLFSPPSHLFFAGDLNYRTSDTRPDASETKTWPQPVESADDPHHYSHMLGHDQLTRELKKGKTLHNLAEAPINFPPTYKLSSGAQKNAVATTTEQHKLADGRTVERTSLQPLAEAQDAWLWAQHRTPSWCDRILFLETAQPKIHAYTALPIQPTSDHRPVALSCTVSAKPVTATVESTLTIRDDWRERRAAARRYELVVGLAAYLALTWEGEALVLGSVVGIVGGYILLRALIAP